MKKELAAVGMRWKVWENFNGLSGALPSTCESQQDGYEKLWRKTNTKNKQPISQWDEQFLSQVVIPHTTRWPHTTTRIPLLARDGWTSMEVTWCWMVLKVRPACYSSIMLLFKVFKLLERLEGWEEDLVETEWFRFPQTVRWVIIACVPLKSFPSYESIDCSAC